MRVVVHHRHPVRGALGLEATADPAEGFEARADGVGRKPQEAARDDGRGRVEDVVAAGDLDAVGDAREREARPGAFEHLALEAVHGVLGEAVGVDAGRQARQDGPHPGVVDAGHHRGPFGQAVEEAHHDLVDLVEARVVLQVIPFEVGQDGDLGRQAADGLVGLVGLGHEEGAMAGTGGAPDGGQVTADQHRGIEPRPEQDRGDHAGRGGLAVGPGDRDGAVAGHQVGEQLGAVANGKPLRPGVGELGVGFTHRSRDHHHLGPRDVLGAMAHVDPDPQAREALGGRRRRLVRAADAAAPLVQDLGDRAHADAADADEVMGGGNLHWGPHVVGDGQDGPSPLGDIRRGKAALTDQTSLAYNAGRES
ncbi:hypothetical protein D3C86_1326470 [compost metagenome]